MRLGPSAVMRPRHTWCCLRIVRATRFRGINTGHIGRDQSHDMPHKRIMPASWAPNAPRDGEGRAANSLDCSPKGDQPGFVKVGDDGKTLPIPDRPGVAARCGP